VGRSHEQILGGSHGKMKKRTHRFVRAAALWVPLVALVLTAGPALAVTATATLGPSSGLSFGYVKVGATSSARKATLTNKGPNGISVGTPSSTGQFHVSTTTCKGSLAAGSSCSISVVFRPTSVGAKTGSLSVTTNATTGANLSIALSGSGALPGAKLSTTSVAFGNWAVNVTSTPKPVRLTNTGKATLKITGISASGDFKQSNDCGSSLGAGEACTISVTFHADALGLRTGKLTVHDDASSGTQTASLSGTGVKLSVGLDPTSLSFRTQRIHTTSITRSATLTNRGAVKLLVSDIFASKSYSQTNTCGSSVPTGASCTISVTFAPEAEGVLNGTVTIKDNAGTQELALSGIGGFPAFRANVKRLSFGELAIGSSSQPRVVKVTNEGTDKLFIDRISTSGDFEQTNTCEPYVNPGITCAISLTFTPTTLNAIKGTLRIRHELGVYKVSLRGVGLPAAGSTPSSAGPNAAPLGPAESSGGRGLTGPLTFIAVLGLVLLLAGGAFLWLTRASGSPKPRRQSPLVDGEDSIRAASEPSADAVEGDEDFLDWFLLGSGDEPQGAAAAATGGNGERGAQKLPFDWETEPGSHLA
jgi:Cep192 domain 4/HYDIN/CFA65/VesB-like, Ig-like domain/Abnormal spindle-like microcephaly-assoc'd, ASPM-SPD-2-Hydin